MQIVTGSVKRSNLTHNFATKVAEGPPILSAFLKRAS